MEKMIRKRKAEVDQQLYTSLSEDAAQLNMDEEAILLAKECDASTLYAIGMKYFHMKKHTFALSWLEKADQQQSADAQFQIGQMYKKGIGVQQNFELAKEYLNKAANNGSGDAQNILGEFCRDGIGMKQDLVGAFQWFDRAAKGGSKNGTFNLGQMHGNGSATGTKDPTKALELYLKAAEMGHGVAKECVATFYRFGLGGVAVDLDMALKWYEKSAAENNNVGAMYSIGDTVMKNYEAKQLAADWFKKAADGGHMLAKDNLKMLEIEGYHPRPIKDTRVDKGAINKQQVGEMDYIALPQVPNEQDTAKKTNPIQDRLGATRPPQPKGPPPISKKQIHIKQREQFKILMQKLMEEPSVDLAQQVKSLMKEIQEQ